MELHQNTSEFRFDRIIDMTDFLFRKEQIIASGGNTP
jgi:hypothetical protein